MKLGETKRQLYSLVRDVEVAQLMTRNPVDGHLESVPLKIFKAAVLISWPNGFPCVEVELYLTNMAYNLRDAQDGGSVKQIATKLTHLIRFCWANQINFSELGESQFYRFTQDLAKEPHREKAGEKMRENNRVREIIETCISFLQWLQENWTKKCIVGLRDCNPQIRLELSKAKDRFGRLTESLVYPFRPQPSTRDLKGVMPTDIKNLCWKAVAEWSDITNQSSVYRARFCSEEDFLEELRYLKARRELLLRLVEWTGARPAEIAETTVSKNHSAVLVGKLLLPTKKNELDAERLIPVSFEVAMKVEIFLNNERAALCKRLRSKGKITIIPDQIFLNLNGKGVTAAALEREFCRISKRAEIDTRACLSMFRHRFITILVAQHLRDIIAKRPDTVFTQGDYRDILAKVQVFTGHRNLMSAMYYIDWAWEELQAFDPVTEAQNIRLFLEGFIPSFGAFIADIPLTRGTKTREKIFEFHTWLIQVQALVQHNSKLQAAATYASSRGRAESSIPT